MDIRAYSGKKTINTTDFHAEFGPNPQLWTIKSIGVYEWSDEKTGEITTKAGVRFHEHPQSIILNKSRGDVIGLNFGWEDTDSVGKALLVRVVPNPTGITNFMFEFSVPLKEPDSAPATVHVKQWHPEASE